MNPIEAHDSGGTPPGANEALRLLLFDIAAKAHRLIIDRIDAAAEGLGTINALRVIGALEGAEEDLRVIRFCMTLVRDHLPPTTK
jgi:hypothetical protein